MAMVQNLSDAEHDIVTAAVRTAELATDGEIVTIVAGQSDDYADIAWAISGLVALTALAMLTAFPDFYLALWHRITGGWTGVTALPVWLFFVVTALKFLGTRLILLWRPLLYFITPPPIKHSRVRLRAIDLFRVGAERRTMGLTGILIYVSMAEHRAEIVADEAITSKVAPEVWGDAMVALITELKLGRAGHGMAAAVGHVGAVLAQHLPKSGANPNELPDRLIEL
ncbi:MAG: hypothetical protein U5J78_03665 [Parasphingorhabdus sp.]|nr:hypothetical protein [Parasphingorhabdus sp.]